MPYKTKASKIAATHRRFNYIETKSDGTYSYKNMTESKPDNADRESSGSINDKLYIKKDLIKIVLASIAIISIQIWLSLTLF